MTGMSERPPDQSRTAVGPALGCVLPRRPGALGHRPAAAGGRAAGRRGRLRRRGARRGLRLRRERAAHRRPGAAGAGRRRGRDRPVAGPREGRRARASTRSSRWPTPCTWSAWAAGSTPCSTAGCSTRSTATSVATTWRASRRCPSRGTTLYVLCFSDVGPGPHGPHPVSQDELRAAFDGGGGWSVARQPGLGRDAVQRRRARRPGWRRSSDRQGNTATEPTAPARRAGAAGASRS